MTTMGAWNPKKVIIKHKNYYFKICKIVAT